MLFGQLLERATWPQLSLLATGLIAVFIIIGRITYDRKIRSLGGYAPKIRNYLPLGIDFIWDGMSSGARDENLAFWHRFFMRFGNPSNPYTVEGNAGGRRIVFTADYENIKAILATQFHDYGKGPRFNKEWHDFLGDSIFSTDHAKWEESRRLVRQQFVKDRVSDLQTFERHVGPLLSLMNNAGPSGSVDVKDLFFRYTLDAATDFLLGRSVDSLLNSQVEFAEAFAEIQRLQNNIARAGPLNMLMPRKTLRKHLAVLNAFVEPFIDEALALPPSELAAKAEAADGKSNYTFLHAIAAYTRDRAVLRDQLVAVLLAGRDTTACTLSWLFYEIGRRPDIVAQLRQEVEETVGLTRAPTYADLKSMKQLQYTMNETLRLYPVVPFNVRVALKDTTLPHGGGPDGLSPIGIPEATPIAYSTHYMQLIESNYPPISEKFPDPALFEPRRWASWQPKHWTYIPFNGGPRLCVGQQFALTEMGYTIVRVLQNFSRIESRQADFNGQSGYYGGFADNKGAPVDGKAEKLAGFGGSGAPLVERVVRDRISMKSEIVLSPATGVQIAFHK